MTQKFTIFIIFVSLISLGLAQNGELSKQEKKELKKEIKDLLKNPDRYKALKEETSNKTQVISQQIENLDEAKRKQIIAQTTIKNLRDSLDFKENEIAKQAQYSTLDGAYRVQIGLFNNYDISQLLESNKLVFHELIAGSHRYSIGNFETIENALLFSEQIKKLGIKDAFVTQYENNVRNTSFTTDGYVPKSNASKNTTSTINSAAKSTKTISTSNQEPTIQNQTETAPTTRTISTTESQTKTITNDNPVRRQNKDSESVIYLD